MPRYESSEKRARELSREGWRYERREGAPKTCLCLFSRFSFLFRRPLSCLRWIRLEEESFLSYPVRLHAEERPRAPNPSRAPERSAQREAMVTWLVDSGCTSQRRSSWEGKPPESQTNPNGRESHSVESVVHLLEIAEFIHICIFSSGHIGAKPYSKDWGVKSWTKRVTVTVEVPLRRTATGSVESNLTKFSDNLSKTRSFWARAFQRVSFF